MPGDWGNTNPWSLAAAFVRGADPSCREDHFAAARYSLLKFVSPTQTHDTNVEHSNYWPKEQIDCLRMETCGKRKINWKDLKLGFERSYSCLDNKPRKIQTGKYGVRLARKIWPAATNCGLKSSWIRSELKSMLELATTGKFWLWNARKRLSLIGVPGPCNVEHKRVWH